MFSKKEVEIPRKVSDIVDSSWQVHTPHSLACDLAGKSAT